MNIVYLGSGLTAYFTGFYDITITNLNGQRLILPIEANKGYYNLANVMGMALYGNERTLVFNFLNSFRKVVG